MHALKPRVHSYLDYAAIVFLFLAPGPIGLVGIAATLAYVLAITYLALALLTAYPGGAFKIVPFTVHGVIEFIAAAALIASPWALNFAADSTARNFFVIVGASLFAVWLVTDYRAGDVTPYSRPAAHH